MAHRLLSFALRRAASALLLVAVVASAALLLARLAPGDHLSAFERDPAAIEAERRRLGLDRPLHEQYGAWAASAIRLDLGESTRFPGRRVSGLVAERARHSLLLGLTALALATMVGVPLGVVTGSRPAASAAAAIRAGALLLVAVPPIVLSLALLLLASRTGWFPVGGLPEQGGVVQTLHHLALPALALGLPAAAILERLQSRSLADALRDPALLAARARGIPRRRLVWGHAFRLAVQPVLAIYGVLVGSLISGSFVVEYLMTWPGLGRLMYDALVFRDANLVAGCAAAGALFLASGVLAAEIALAAVDPRSRDAR